MKKDLNVMTWVFFVSKGVTDNSDLMRCQMLLMETMNDGATVESVKNSIGYKSCIYDIPNSLINNEAIQKMIDF